MAKQGNVNTGDAPKTGLAKIPEACRFLQCSVTKLRQLRQTNKLVERPIGRAKRVTWASLHAYANGEPLPVS